VLGRRGGDGGCQTRLRRLLPPGGATVSEAGKRRRPGAARSYFSLNLALCLARRSMIRGAAVVRPSRPQNAALDGVCRG
jgi:hypothetical protein